MDYDLVLCRTSQGKSPDCWDIAVKVVSFFRSCLADHLGDGPLRVGGCEPELLVEQGLEIVAKLLSLLFWVLLIPALVLQFFQYYICSLHIFFFLDICAVKKTLVKYSSKLSKLITGISLFYLLIQFPLLEEATLLDLEAQ